MSRFSMLQTTASDQEFRKLLVLGEAEVSVCKKTRQSLCRVWNCGVTAGMLLFFFLLFFFVCTQELFLDIHGHLLVFGIFHAVGSSSAGEGAQAG